MTGVDASAAERSASGGLTRRAQVENTRDAHGITRIREIPGGGPVLGPYSQVTIANGFVFTSGQVPQTADGDTPETLEAEVEQLIANLRAALEAAGTSLDRVVKVNGYLSRLDQLDTFNRVFAAHFGDIAPARTTVCVGMWGVSMELDCVAALPESETSCDRGGESV